MRQCLIFRRLISLFGLLMPLCMGLSAQAASVCSQLLLKDDFYISSLTDLAQLRLEIDLAQVKGPLANDLVTSSLNDKYPLKYQELVQELSKRFSIDEIKTMIFEKIRQLQGESKVKKEKEIRVRRQQERDFIPKAMKLEKSIPIDTNLNTYFDYFPEQGKVFYISRLGSSQVINLKMLDLQSERVVTLEPDAVEAVTMPGGKKVLALTRKNTLHIYDVMTGAVEVLQAPSKPTDSWIDSVSPDGSWVSIGNHVTPFFFNLKTGQVVDRNPLIPSGIDAKVLMTHFFSDPNTYTVVGKEFVGKLNLKRVSSSKKRKTDDYDRYLQLADGREVLAFSDSSPDHAARFSVSNLHNPLEVLPLGNLKRPLIAKVSSRRKEFILTKRAGQDVSLWRMDSLQGLPFVFDRYQEGSERGVTHSAIAADGSSVVFVVYISSDEPLHVEKWIRMEEGDANVPTPRP